jgi:hypothetical protein
MRRRCQAGINANGGHTRYWLWYFIPIAYPGQISGDNNQWCSAMCCYASPHHNTAPTKRLTLKWNCSTLCHSVHPSSGQQRHISAGQRSTTCCASSAWLSDTAKCWYVTMSSSFTRFFTHWACLTRERPSLLSRWNQDSSVDRMLVQSCILNLK